MGRVTINGTVAQFSCKRTIPRELWDVRGNRAKGKSKEAIATNLSLDNIKAQIIKHYQRLSDREAFVTAEMVRNAYQGLGSEYDTLLKSFDRDCASLLKRVGKDRSMGTYKVMLRARENTARFIRYKYNRSDMSMLELTPDFIRDFAVYLSTVKGNRNATIWLNCMWLKGVVMRAHFNGKIPRNPFAQFHVSPSTKEREFLTEDELKKLMAHEFADSHSAFVRDLFVFASFTALSFVDLKKLTTDDIVEVNGEKWILAKRHKTHVPYQVKLLDVPLQIIDRYRPFQKDNSILGGHQLLDGLQEAQEGHLRVRYHKGHLLPLRKARLCDIGTQQGHAHREREPCTRTHKHRNHATLCEDNHRETRHRPLHARQQAQRIIWQYQNGMTMKGKDINGKARQIITMDEHGNITVPNGEIWMGEYEIADLFGVFGHSVRTQVKEITRPGCCIPARQRGT